MLLSEHLGLKIKCSLEHGFNLKYQELFSRLHHGWGGELHAGSSGRPSQHDQANDDEDAGMDLRMEAL